MAERPAVELLQLPRVTVVEKPGEFREACAGESRYGDPERSLLNGLCGFEHSVSRNVQRLGIAEPEPIKSHKRPASLPGSSGKMKR